MNGVSRSSEALKHTKYTPGAENLTLGMTLLREMKRRGNGVVGDNSHTIFLIQKTHPENLPVLRFAQSDFASAPYIRPGNIAQVVPLL
jgi:hypothetical protein